MKNKKYATVMSLEVIMVIQVETTDYPISSQYKIYYGNGMKSDLV